MNKDQSTYQLIEDYLMGRLSEADKSSFEARLASDDSFKEYFEGHNNANDLIIAKEELNIKRQLQEIHVSSGSGGANRASRIYWGMGLVFLALVTGLWWNSNHDKPVAIDQEEEYVSTRQLEDIDEPNLGHEIIEDQSIDVPNQPISKVTLGMPEIAGHEIEKNPIPEEVESFKEEVSKPGNTESPRSLEALAPELIGELENYSEPSPEKLTAELAKPIDDETKPCEDFYSEIVFDTKATCNSKRNGAILVQLLEGASHKTFSIDNGPAVESREFTGLAPGEYNIRAFSMEGCPSLPRSVVVEGYDCVFIIYPNENKYWDINLASFKEGEITLEIYNARSGKQVYNQILSAFESNQWDGRSSTGQELPMGSYTYVIQSSGQSQIGSVTIVR